MFLGFDELMLHCQNRPVVEYVGLGRGFNLGIMPRKILGHI